MAGRIIQGFFPSGNPIPLPSTAQQTSAVYAPRALGGPAVQRHGGHNPLLIDPARLGLADGVGQALPDVVRGKMETAFGTDFSSVRVHVGPQPDRIGAHAFTIGNDIYFASGRYQPDSLQGLRLLGHELAHVVQQRQGRVRAPNAGIAVMQDAALEAEAIRFGERAIAQTKAAASTLQPKPAGSSLWSGKIGMGPGVTQQHVATTNSRTIQRSGKELAGLAIQVFPGPTVEVQNQIVKRLEEYVAAGLEFYKNAAKNKGVGQERFFPVMFGTPTQNVSLGSVRLPTDLSQYDQVQDLIDDSTLVETPNGATSVKSIYKIIKDDEPLKKGIITNTIRTMETAGQIKYLKNLNLSGEKWNIIVEIHYYRERVQSEPGFHKDSVGETLFVNLNYVNEEEISGPEYIVNPPVDPQHLKNREETLPKKFRTHLKEAGTKLLRPRSIGMKSVPKYGVVTFVDELIHHKTPTPGHRKVPANNLGEFLTKKFPQGNPSAWWEDLIRLTKSGGTFDRNDLQKAGLPQDLIDEVVNDYSENAAGFNKVDIPHRGKATVRYDIGTPRLKRAMSAGNLRATPLQSGGSGRRAFFRTWVRAVRKK
ncbi:MAG TPA: DUF4157 domain-containing protein [Bryobacteraceae bacterium]|jgi:hypothetical protein